MGKLGEPTAPWQVQPPDPTSSGSMQPGLQNLLEDIHHVLTSHISPRATLCFSVSPEAGMTNRPGFPNPKWPLSTLPTTALLAFFLNLF